MNKKFLVILFSALTICLINSSAMACLSFVGPQGPQGPKGDPGESIVGPQGPAGYTPIKGVDFDDGINGVNGRNGEDGKDADCSQYRHSSEIRVEGTLRFTDTQKTQTSLILGRNFKDKPYTYTTFNFTYKIGESYTDKKLKELEKLIKER